MMLVEDEKQKQRAAAYHESAHAVIAFAGYKFNLGLTHEEVTVKFPNNAKIYSIEIKEENGDWVGEVTASYTSEFLGCDSMNSDRRSWNIIRLLAGYAAEFSYKITQPKDVVSLSAIDKEEVRKKLNEYRLKDPMDAHHDFEKVFTCLNYVFLHGPQSDKYKYLSESFFDELILDNFMYFWKETEKILADEPLLKAIIKIAELLIKQKRLTEEEFDKQKDKYFGIKELKKYLITLPNIYLPDVDVYYQLS